jgi:hypothetical protein
MEPSMNWTNIFDIFRIACLLLKRARTQKIIINVYRLKCYNWGYLDISFSLEYEGGIRCLGSIEHFIVFLVTGFILNITPGNDTIYILSRTIKPRFITQDKAGLRKVYSQGLLTISWLSQYLDKITGVIFTALGINLLRYTRVPN